MPGRSRRSNAANRRDAPAPSGPEPVVDVPDVGGSAGTGTTTQTTTTTTPTLDRAAGAGGAGSSQVDAAALQAVSAAAVAVCPAEYATYGATAIPLILNECAQAGVKLPDQAAYVLATAEHESGFGTPKYSRSESLVEDSNPFSQSRNGTWSSTVHTNDRRVTASSEAELETEYWDSAYGDRLGNREGTSDGADFRGRGYVQLTGRSNYQTMSDHLNETSFSYTLDGVTYGGQGNPAIDLVANPTHVNRVPQLAARALVEGSQDGMFRPPNDLDEHINEDGTDFTAARGIINADVSTIGPTVATIANRYARVLRANNAWAAVFQPAWARPNS